MSMSSRARPGLVLPLIVQERAARTPDREALTFLQSAGDAQLVTYAELDRGARAVAASLQQHGSPGDRVLIVCPPGPAFVQAFFGVMYAGRVAVPSSPIAGKRDQTRLSELVQRARPSVVCAGALQAPRVERWLRDQSGTPERVLYLGASDLTPAAHHLELRDPEDWQPTRVRPDDLAFLQFTSGSIGAPKGVMVEQQQLLHNLEQIYRNFGFHDDSRGVIWLPPYHDMGLIGGILSPLHGGFPVTLMPPTTFMRRPQLWLETITRYRATTSGGPGFAYDLCVKHVSEDALAGLDLSSWSVAFVGAEPIQAPVLERFARRFAKVGFRERSWWPCYGLAESVLMVTSTEPGDGLRTAEAPERGADLDVFSEARSGSTVSCGAPQDTRVEIVDPATSLRLADGQVGELWVQGPSVARGYWGQPEQTAATFGARLATGEGPFLRTGDLAFVQDDRVFIHGRSKEVIIVGGRNIYPTDVEYAAQLALDGARPNSGAAFGLPGDPIEGVVLVQELPEGQASAEQLAAMGARIREAVAAAIGVELAQLLLVAPHTVPRTTSGKVQRITCRKRFDANEIAYLWRWESGGGAQSARERPEASLDLGQLTRLVCELMADQLGVDAAQVNEHTTFADSGCDSKGIAAIGVSLANLLGERLEADLLYRMATPHALATHLVSRRTQQGGSPARVFEAAPASELEPIAIVGLACRVPGAWNASELWSLLDDERDAIGRVPEDRWDRKQWLLEGRSKQGTIYTDRMGCIDAPYAFDAAFFGIDDRAALALDPQQRIILELCWHALEDAHVRPSSLAGRGVGVFMGATHADYAQLVRANAAITSQTAPGTALSAISGRVSYLLGLQGPAMTVDTACSSSLVAIHTACHYLRAGECEIALCGGVSLVLAPDTTAALCRMRALSPTGRSAAFAEGADGYVRGEGAGVVVLKPLRRALADGDRIYACIAGSAVNQDGLSNGFTAPNADAQEAVIRRALLQAGPRVAGAVSYVEAHGTGTRLGDPIEVLALSRAYTAVRSGSTPLLVGSLKTNIGHLEAAAGVVSLIKVALAIRHKRLPASLNCQQPSTLVRWDELGVRVADRTQVWTQDVYAAGLSSFGFTGTNVHAVITGAPAQPTEAEAPAAQGPVLFCVSARSPGALHQLLADYREWLVQHPDISLQALCANLAHGRDHHRVRYAMVVESCAELKQQLAKAISQPGAAGAFEPNHIDSALPAQLVSAAARYRAGETLDWNELFPERPNLPHALPGYAFERRVYRYPSGASAHAADVKPSSPQN